MLLHAALLQRGCFNFITSYWSFPPEKEMATHSSSVAWRIPWAEKPGGLLSMGLHRVGHNWSNLAGVRALEKEMATHSNVLAWRIPGTVEPGGLPSMGSHRVGHDWSNLAAAAAALELPRWSVVKNLPAKAGDSGDAGSIPGLGRSPGGGHGNPL